MKAKDLLAPGETALAVFTHGDHLKINPDGTGQTGIWVIDPNRNTERVIIYWRREMYPGVENEIYIANRTAISIAPNNERYFVHFHCAQQVGTTVYNWPEFSEGGQNPVKYISRPG